MSKYRIFVKRLLFPSFSKQKNGQQKDLRYGKLLPKIWKKWNIYPKFKVEQHSVRDRLKKLIKQFRRKENDERRASGISPEFHLKL
jgi:hypothetical protein